MNYKMATVTFRLDNPTNKDGSLKNEDVAIRVCLYVSKARRPDLSSQEVINPKHWNKEKGQAKATLTGHTKLNLRLMEIQRDLLELWKGNKDADTAELKNLMVAYLKGKDHNVRAEKKNDAPFVGFVEQLIADCESGRIIRAASTVQTYQQTLDHITAFASIHRLYLTFESITLDFYKGFTAYLWDTAGQSDNTVGKHIKNIKAWMNSAFDEDLHSNLAFKKKKFNKMTTETDEVYLTQDEILKIYSLNLSDSPSLAVHRDMFVFACWTGMRFGDLCNIKPEQVEQRFEGKFLHVHTEKTHEDVIIPFHPLAEAIYSYYNHRLPRIEKTYNAVFNSDLKLICDRAGLDSLHQSRTVKRGKATFVYLKKKDMVSAHTARRSFATNCELMGIPRLTIMAITGHKTEKAYLKYIRTTKVEHADIMMKHFNTSPISSVMRKAQ